MPALRNQQHEAFCHHFSKTKKLEQSYVAAGYKAKTTKQGSTTASRCAYRLYRRPEVQARLQEIAESSARKLEISRDRWLWELAAIAFNDPRRFFTEAGVPVNISELKRHVAAAIGGFEVVENRVGGVTIGITKKFKLIDKVQALTIIGKHLGFIVEKHEHTGPDGGPIELAAVRDIKDSLLNKVARLASSGASPEIYSRADAERSTGPAA